MVPSIENTPSVTMILWRLPAAACSCFPGRPCRCGRSGSARLAQADAVDDGGVVQRIGDDGVVLVEQRFEHAAVGVEGRRVQDGVLGAEEFGDGLLQLFVHGLGAADEAHRRQAVAVFFRCVDGSLRHPLLAGQAEVVVGAHIDQGAAIFAHHFRALARSQHAFRLVQALLAQLIQILLEAAVEGVFLIAHDGPCM
jgi:hypothetical protein